MDTSKLEELGLRHNEALVYLALLQIGQTKTGAIVKKTGLHRVLIYDALESLIKKGLAAYVVKENIKYFNALNPDRLSDFLKEKENIAKELSAELQKLTKINERKQSVEIYEGIKGLKAALNNMLSELTLKDYHYVFASGNMEPTLKEYYYIYQKEKEKKRIKTKIIYDASFRVNKEIIHSTYGSVKFYSLGPFPTDTWIYKDKVLIVTYTANPPIAILITSKETSDSYKRLFESLWKKSHS